MTGRPRPKDGIGSFTSHYLDCPNEALYPFGYGLSYTDFRVSEIRLSGETLSKAGSITAAVTLKIPENAPEPPCRSFISAIWWAAARVRSGN